MNIGASNTTQAEIARKAVTIIRPLRGWVPINLRELWAYRELLYFFTWRDIKVRYKQMLLGFARAIASFHMDVRKPSQSYVRMGD
jgi:hypothetical protein